MSQRERLPAIARTHRRCRVIYFRERRLILNLVWHFISETKVAEQETLHLVAGREIALCFLILQKRSAFKSKDQTWDNKTPNPPLKIGAVCTAAMRWTRARERTRVPLKPPFSTCKRRRTVSTIPPEQERSHQSILGPIVAVMPGGWCT